LPYRFYSPHSRTTERDTVGEEADGTANSMTYIQAQRHDVSQDQLTFEPS